MEILVMGGTEFVSSSIAKHMIYEGNTVDIFTRGRKKVNYEGIRNHLVGDRLSPDDLKKCLLDKRYDVIFDISAYTSEDVEKLTSVINTSKLKRYIFCSSGAVYKPTEKMVAEDYPRGFNNNWRDYGLNKKKAEDYLFDLYKTDNFPITIFRPTYIYGDGNNLYREVYLFDRINKGLDIPIPKGYNKTQFIHINDLVKVFESAIYCDKSIGEAYNVTHREQITWKHLVKTSLKVMDKKIKIHEIDYKTMGIKPRQFFPFRDVTYLLNTEKLEKHGLYIPKINLEEGLIRSYKWYISEKPQLQDLKMDKMDFVI